MYVQSLGMFMQADGLVDDADDDDAHPSHWLGGVVTPRHSKTEKERKDAYLAT